MGSKMVFWNTEFSRATAYLTDSGSLAEGGRGEENLLPDRGEKHFSKEKVVLSLDIINGPVSSIHFSFKR